MSRSTKLGPGGNTIANSGNYNFNKYKGQSSIDTTSISNYYALKRLASFCKSDCADLQTLPKTIIQYNTSQGNSFIWDTQTFILNSSLPNFSYVATITSIPATPVPSPNYLINVNIGNNVTSIGTNAFQNCSALTSLTLPNSVTTIGIYAFGGCSELISLRIPNSVTTIGQLAFFGCSKLTTVYISQSKAQQLGNLLNKTWTSPGTVVSPDFYEAPLNVSFQL